MGLESAKSQVLDNNYQIVNSKFEETVLELSNQAPNLEIEPSNCGFNKSADYWDGNSWTCRENYLARGTINVYSKKILRNNDYNIKSLVSMSTGIVRVFFINPINTPYTITIGSERNSADRFDKSVTCSQSNLTSNYFDIVSFNNRSLSNLATCNFFIENF